MRELIIGGPSIFEALKNPGRSDFEIVATEEGLEKFKKRFKKTGLNIDQVKVTFVSSHQVQERAKMIIEEGEGTYQRIPSNLFLLCSPLSIITDLHWAYQLVEQRDQLRILCLDQVTDVHNGAAILRSAAFYGLDMIVFARKGNFSLSPQFYRLASGGAEWVPIVQCGNLSRFLVKLQELDVTCFGLTEHGEDEFRGGDNDSARKKVCLVLGTEESGLSHAVLRVVNRQVSLRSQGKISSLNVSVAAAIAMEKTWGKP